jgi:hypothetical protein
MGHPEEEEEMKQFRNQLSIFIASILALYLCSCGVDQTYPERDEARMAKRNALEKGAETVAERFSAAQALLEKADAQVTDQKKAWDADGRLFNAKLKEAREKISTDIVDSKVMLEELQGVLNKWDQRFRN